MSKQEFDIDRVVQEAQLTGVKSIDQGKSGYSSQSFNVVCDQGELIILAPKAGGVKPPDYAYHYVILEQLQAAEYPYAPRAIYLPQDRGCIVITKVPGNQSTWLNSAPVEQQLEAIRKIIDALLQLDAVVSFEKTSEAYKQLTGKSLHTVKIQDNVQKFQTNWFARAQEGQPDKDLSLWLEPKVRLCEKRVKDENPGEKITVVHGDTVAGNMFMTDDMQLHFIDWDSSGFDQYPERWNNYNLAYILLQIPYFQNNRAYALDYLAEQAQIDRDQLETSILESQEITQIGDIVWAYMMHALSVVGEVEGEPAKFLKIAHQRIEYYEEHFGDSNFLHQ